MVHQRCFENHRSGVQAAYSSRVDQESSRVPITVFFNLSTKFVFMQFTLLNFLNLSFLDFRFKY